ncbi:hypothetical protein L228DRAFT_269481 [Xylona heveae TC161]|uniref:FAS1 domain-containing protein n=1 Tax=Xylona heveae (strain CBS 132557 / TC161) TaxID=1328760 RepID=A0A165FKD0_XYLHT|nr:hypothetical protein L228DRAFT_269481 [Xylona heveae TC161]KZF21079.1 hypothetical protein L228DRAFT_269481 [Xylona heveae TC161]
MKFAIAILALTISTTPLASASHQQQQQQPQQSQRNLFSSLKQLVAFANPLPPPPPPPPPPAPHHHHPLQQQQVPVVMDPNNIALPPSHKDNDDPSQDHSPGGPGAGGNIIISDVIGKERSINIFAGFTRDIESVSNRLENDALNTTVLAPLNSAITKLPRKPWEDPQDYAAKGADAYAGPDGESKAHENLRRFTEAHIVPANPWKEGEKVKTEAGNVVWWETKDGEKIIQPGNIKVSSVLKQVANGEVWIIQGVLNYS